MWNRALRDEDFRQRVSGHYQALDASAAPVFEGLANLLGRTARPPFTPEMIGAIITAVAEGLALRASLSPGFYPQELFGWIVATISPLLTREPGDERDATGFVADLPLHIPPTDV
jgi:hypothetical protein